MKNLAILSWFNLSDDIWGLVTLFCIVILLEVIRNYWFMKIMYKPNSILIFYLYRTTKITIWILRIYSVLISIITHNISDNVWIRSTTITFIVIIALIVFFTFDQSDSKDFLLENN